MRNQINSQRPKKSVLSDFWDVWIIIFGRQIVKPLSAALVSLCLLQGFLPLLDSLNAALSAKQLSAEEKKGIALVKGQFEEILKKEGVSEIPALGKHFDSGMHECLLRESVPAKADGIVLDSFDFRNNYSPKEKKCSH